MYDVLPPNEKNFDFDAKGQTTGLNYKGRFKCRCVLDISSKHVLELEKTRLMADSANPTASLQGIALTMATLRAKLIEWPSWWEDQDYGQKIIDENILLELFDVVEDAEVSWRAALISQAAKAAGEKDAKEESESGNEKGES